MSDIRFKDGDRSAHHNESSKRSRQNEDSLNSQSCEEAGAKVKIEPDMHGIDGQTTQAGTTRASVMKSPNESKQAVASDIGNCNKNAYSKNSDK